MRLFKKLNLKLQHQWICLRNSAFTLIETIIALTIMLGAFVVLSMTEPNWNIRLKWIESKLNATSAASVLAFEPFSFGASQITLSSIIGSKYQLNADNYKNFNFDTVCKLDVTQISNNDTNITVYIEDISTKDGSISIYRIKK